MLLFAISLAALAGDYFIDYFPLGEGLNLALSGALALVAIVCFISATRIVRNIRESK